MLWCHIYNACKSFAQALRLGYHHTRKRGLELNQNHAFIVLQCSVVGRLRSTLLQGLLSLGLMLAAMPSAAAQTVTVSFSILADLSRKIAGEDFAIVSLVGPDQDAHVFRPAPADLQRMQESVALVSVGAGFESWLPRMVRSAEFSKPHFVAVEHLRQPLQVSPERADAHHDAHHHHEHHHHEHGQAPEAMALQIDPHWWHSPQAGAEVVMALAHFFAQLKPQAAERFQANALRLQEALLAFDRQAREAFQNIPPKQRYLVVPHNEFGWLARDYDLQTFSVLGLSTESSADAKTMAHLIRLIREDNIKAVFLESTTDARLMQQIREETGVAIGGTLIAGGLSSRVAPDYLSMLRYNLDLIVSALAR